MSKLKKALEKAKEAREQGITPTPEPEITAAAEHPPAAEKAPTPSPAPARSAARSQPQTKVVASKRETLKKNKIIAGLEPDAFSDHIKIMRTRILNLLEKTGGNSLLITSPLPGEGKTLTAINLAISISHEIDRTTLLVDADLRTPMINNYFGIPNGKGLSDYLQDKATIPELLINPGIEKLTILPGGSPIPNSSELLGAPRMESLVDEMKKRYPDRFLIFDSSSLLTSADPLVFSRYIDGILLVVEAERTPRSAIEQAMEMLKDKPVLGTVFNKEKGRSRVIDQY